MIDLTGVSKVYPVKNGGQVVALDGVNLHVDRGSIHGIVGRSGAGKSTLIRCLTALEKPTEGHIVVDGHDLAALSGKPLRAARRRIGMVFQAANLLDARTAAENIGYPLKLAGVPAAQRRARVEELLTLVGLEGRGDSYPSQLSGGQRQRVGIARALIMNPKLIIADECISALDVSIQAQVVNLMKDIQEETQCAYLFIAHDLSMVKYISDRIGVLHLGYMVESGTKEEIFSHPVHPYTKSLLSAIPHPNPVVEKHRVALTYNYATSGIDYAKGTEHSVGGTHTVLATDEEFDAWTK